jgi:hypothetical protein
MSGYLIEGKVSDLIKTTHPQTFKKLSLAFALALTGMAASTLAMAQPMLPKYRCPDGEYRGPEAGKTSYVKDEFSWFVTRDFAKRFCMPESFVDDQLKGAEAIAWRVKPSEEAFCTLRDGKETCTRKTLFEMDLYLKSSLALPRSDSEVEFYWNDLQPITSSGEVISNHQRSLQSYARQKGQYQEPAGGRPPFHAFSGPGESKRVNFLYLRVMPQGTLNVQTNLVEHYYRANWVDGINLVSLRSSTALGLGTIDDPRNPNRDIRKFAVGIIRRTDLPPGGMEDYSRLTRRDYPHVIDLPDKLGALISDYDSRRWNQMIGPLKDAISGQAPAASGSSVSLSLRP